MTDTAAPTPPPIIEAWRVALMVVLIGAIVLWVHLLPKPARAETIGFRIEAQACRGAVCQPLAPSPRVWPALYSCQTRAANLERFGLPGEPRAIRARCAPVVGLPSA